MVGVKRGSAKQTAANVLPNVNLPCPPPKHNTQLPSNKQNSVMLPKSGPRTAAVRSLIIALSSVTAFIRNATPESGPRTTSTAPRATCHHFTPNGSTRYPPASV